MYLLFSSASSVVNSSPSSSGGGTVSILPEQYKPHVGRSVCQQFLDLSLAHSNHNGIVDLQDHVPPLDLSVLLSRSPLLYAYR